MPIGAFRLNTLSKAVSSAISYITATGGDSITYINVSGTTYKVHKFTTTGSNNFVVTSGGSADILLVGSGGSGGGTEAGSYFYGGGGGGGQVVYQTNVSTTAQTYVISVGAGVTGTSGGDGTAGNSSTGLGYTAIGGGSGTRKTDATNGGGAGSDTATTHVSTAGTFPYKGGNGFGASLGSSRASGGGAGAGGAGVNATNGSGGNGGPGVQNNIDGQNLYYGSGGGGSGTSAGQAYDTTGTLTSAISYGSGRNSAGNGNNVGTSGQYGAGGGGAMTTSVATAYAGGSSRQGVAIIRYPLQTPFSLSFVTSVTSTSSTITIPATAQVGDVVMLFDFGYITSTTAPTSVIPTGFTAFTKSASSQTTSPACRSVVSRKILVAGDPGSTITGMNTTSMNKLLVVYRPNATINTVTSGAQNGQATANAPTNQTLTLTSTEGTWFVGYAMYCSSGSITTRGSSTTETRELNVGTTMYVKLFENLNGTTTFADSTISMADYGSNILNSDALSFS